MEKLWEDADNLHRILPHVSQEDLISFLRRVPLRHSNQRCDLALLNFLSAKDAEVGEALHWSVEEDALLISTVLRDIDYHDVKKRLKVLGNIADRREVIIRQLLHEKYENSSRKRKDDKPLDEMTAIKIKIRKRDGTLEVTSTLTPSPLKQQQVPPELQCVHQFPNAETMGTAVIPAHQPSPSLDSDSSRRPDSGASSRSLTPELRMPPSAYYSDQKHEQLMNTMPTLVDTKEEESFDLVAYLKEVTVVPLKRILSECQRMNLNLAKRPTDYVMDTLITRLLNPSEVIEVDSEDDIAIITNSNTAALQTSVKIQKTCIPKIQSSTRHIEKPCQLDRPKRLKRRPSCTVTNAEALETNKKCDYKNEPEFVMELDDSNQRQMAYFSDVRGISERPGPSTTQHNQANHKPITSNMMYRTGYKRMYESDEDEESSTLEPPLKSPASDDYNSKAPAGKSTIPGSSASTDILDTEEADMMLEALEQDLHEAEAAIETHIAKKPQASVDLSTEKLEEDKPETIDFQPPKPVQSNVIDGALEPMAGPSHASEPKPKKRNLCQKLVQKMMELFPEACPDFVKDACDGKVWEDLEDIMNVFLDGNYQKRAAKKPSPERELDSDEQFAILQDLLPDADPTFLRMQSEKYAGQAAGLWAWAEQAIEKRDFPTMKEYLRKQQLSAQQKQYTTEFNIEKFVQLFNNPMEYFKKHRIIWDDQSVHYASTYLKNRFDRLSVRAIQDAFKAADRNLTLTIAQLSAVGVELKTRRKQTPLPTAMINIPLLQQIAYITHEHEIEAYLKSKHEAELEERKNAKSAGLMETCACCYDEEVMPRDVTTCPNGCKFCADCVKRSAEVAFGDGKLDFSCLMDCGENFTLQTLQHVLQPQMFSKLAQKKAVQEVQAAGIEELETCPFCDFATIPAPGDRLFRCLNDDCMKESCRLCREPSHVPLRCDEVEKDEDVKARVYVENKMTEALLRKCYKCGTKFFKEEGCNKMTCSCGAMMCYICSKPVKDYSHFNGIGGDKFHLCPLYSDNVKVNELNVVMAAEEAKREVDPSNLKVDPAADVLQHFRDRRRQIPNEPHMQALAALRLDQQQFNRHIRAPIHHPRIGVVDLPLPIRQLERAFYDRRQMFPFLPPNPEDNNQ